jgi:uncharacterized oligopeptide transporter (OPT) family protein
VDVGHTILGVVLAFLLSFIGVQASGTVGINPVGPIGKCSQLVFGGISKMQGQNLKDAQTVNLLAGSLAGQAASHSVDMVADLKIGHFLGATPKSQFWAQLWGTVLTIVPMTGVFVFYTKAYPCIIDHDIEKCPFELPAVMAWKAVAVAMTQPNAAIPKSSGILFSLYDLTPNLGICAIVLGIIAILTVIVKYRLPQKYQVFVPNWVGVGLAFIAPFQSLAFAMVVGAIFAALWKRYKPTSWHLYGYPSAAGLSAGEGCAGLVLAGMTLAGFSSENFGSELGCPWQ